MFNIYTEHPYANNQQCGTEDSWYTAPAVLNNCSKYRNPTFIDTVNQLGKNQFILDIGCGTGLVVEDLLKSGHKACGVDGFYVYKKYLAGAWKDIPYNLFTCDIGQDFTISYHEYARFDKTPYQFDIILTSEFMEHLYPDQVNQACLNIVKHLKQDGILIAEISNKDDGGHYTLRNAEWWIDEFKKIGLIEDPALNILFLSKYYRNLDTSHKFCFRKI